MSSIQAQAAPNKFFGSNVIIGKSISPNPLTGSGPMSSDIHDLGFRNDFTNWRGQSGTFYSLNEVSVDDFILNDDYLYMLVANEVAVWIGSASDLIEDSASRAQFRQAVKSATKAYRLQAPDNQNLKIALIADLFPGRPVSSLHAA